MKNYNEIANEIFRRRDMYIANQRKKRKTVVCATAILCSFALVALIGISVLQRGMLSPYGAINSIDNITPKLTASPAITDEAAVLPTPELSASLHKKRFDTVDELVAYAKTQPRWKAYEFIPILKNIENKFIICEILANETYVWISYVDVNRENIDFPVCLQIGMMTTTDYNGYLGWAKNVIGGTETTISGKPMIVRKNSFSFQGKIMTETYYLFNEGTVEMSIRVPQWAASLGTPEYFTDLEHILFV